MPMKRTLEDIAKLSPSELDAVFEAGLTPDFEALSGWEFRGLNTPFFAKLIGIQKFTKGFFKKGGAAFGYNIPIKQNGIKGHWIYKPSDADPKRFGFYTVKPVDPDSKENKHPHALLLNYGEGGNPFFGFTWILRDYLVQIDEGNKDLFLGRAYVRLGPIRFFSNFFILDRYRESALK